MHQDTFFFFIEFYVPESMLTQSHTNAGTYTHISSLLHTLELYAVVDEVKHISNCVVLSHLHLVAPC